MNWSRVILMAFDEFKGEGDGQKVEVVFDLQQDVTFSKDCFAGSKVLPRLVAMKLGDETLAVKMDG